jgi:alkylhydroperoxidase family enzyme
MGSHAAVAALLLGDQGLVDAVLADPATAPISDAEKALFVLVAKVTRDTTTVTADDLQAAREAGWTDEALYDAITVTALFQFYNTWVDATGVGAMTPEAYAASGRRIAYAGYARDD